MILKVFKIKAVFFFHPLVQDSKLNVNWAYLFFKFHHLASNYLSESLGNESL